MCACTWLWFAIYISGKAPGFLVLPKENLLYWGTVVSGAYTFFYYFKWLNNLALHVVMFIHLSETKRKKNLKLFYQNIWQNVFCCNHQFHYFGNQFVHRNVRADEIDPEVKFYPDYCNSIFYVFNVATAIKIVKAAKVKPCVLLHFAKVFFFRPPSIFSSTMSLWRDFWEKSSIWLWSTAKLIRWQEAIFNNHPFK